MKANAAGIARDLLAWYERHGRRNLPWRRVRDPYYTVVSEFMLQQTQVERVVPKFEKFVRRFPNFAALARASAADVVREWEGLGYNLRATRLKRLAETVMERCGGALPAGEAALLELPGIGPYTANAVAAFAFNHDVAASDVNVRRVVHRVALGVEFPAQATDRQLDALAQRLVPAGSGHDWNSALMDLGATVCSARAPKCLLCPLRRWCAAAPIDAAALERQRRTNARAPSGQAALKFERTDRFARGRIVDRLRRLPPGQAISLLDLHSDLEPRLHERDVHAVRKLVAALERDGIVRCTGDAVTLAD